MTLAITIAVAAVAYGLLVWLLDRWRRETVAEIARLRRAARLEADARVVTGADPLPPGVSLSDAFHRASETGETLAEAAFEIHRTETLARIRKAVRRPRPGD